LLAFVEATTRGDSVTANVDDWIISSGRLLNEGDGVA